MREEVGIMFALLLIGLGWAGFVAGIDWLVRFVHRGISSLRRGMERKA